MQIPSGNLTLAVAMWHEAADAYAVQLLALEHGTPGAVAELNHACRHMRECKVAVDALTAPMGQESLHSMVTTAGRTPPR